MKSNKKKINIQQANDDIFISFKLYDCLDYPYIQISYHKDLVEYLLIKKDSDKRHPTMFGQIITDYNGDIISLEVF